MALSKKEIDEFKEIYAKEFGETISDEKAQELGENLIALFGVIYRPIPKEWMQKFREEKLNKS